LVTGAGGQKTSDGATGPTKKFDDIFSGVDTMHQHDREMDRQTDTGRQQGPRLHIALCSKNAVPYVI